MQAFSQIIDQIKADPYLHTHLRYYVREVRVVAYSQARLLPAAVLLSCTNLWLLMHKLHHHAQSWKGAEAC